LIGAIIGRLPESVFVRPAPPGHDPVLVCTDLASGDAGPLTFHVNRGEMIALVGLRGAGQETVGRALIGVAIAGGLVIGGGCLLAVLSSALDRCDRSSPAEASASN
jgi:ribose transport system ATP-binding protein